MGGWEAQALSIPQTSVFSTCYSDDQRWKYFTNCSCYELREKLIHFLDVMATLDELPTGFWTSWSEQEKGLLVSVSGSREEFYKNQPEMVSDSMLWSLSFLLLIHKDFRQSPLLGIVKVQRENQTALWDLRDVQSWDRATDTPTINRPKHVLLCLCFDWGKHSGEN